MEWPICFADFSAEADTHARRDACQVETIRQEITAELSEAEQQELLERTNQIREQRAETQLDLANLFLEKKKPDIAVRRLQEIIAGFSGTEAAKNAKALIKKL